MTKFILVISFFLLTACATKPRIEYDETVRFSQYQSFQWLIPVPDDEVTDPILDSQLLDKRVQNIVVDILQAQGYAFLGTVQEPVGQPGNAEALETTADLLVTYHVTSKTTLQRSPFSLGIGYNRYYRYWGNRLWYEPRFDTVEEAILIIDIIDAQTDTLIWRGWEQGLRTQKNAQAPALRHDISQILSRFPPGA